MLNNHESRRDLERLLDEAGAAHRRREIESPPEPPEEFLHAVRTISGRNRPNLAMRHRALTSAVALAACLALVVTAVRLQGLFIAPAPADPAAAAKIGSLNPLSAGALRLRNLDRPFEDADLPAASNVHWVARTSPLGR